MSGPIATVIERVRGYVEDDEGTGGREASTDGGRAQAETTTRPPSTLYHCPDCDTVYVASDKQTCGTCGTDVTNVESTVPNGTDW